MTQYVNVDLAVRWREQAGLTGARNYSSWTKTVTGLDKGKAGGYSILGNFIKRPQRGGSLTLQVGRLHLDCDVRLQGGKRSYRLFTPNHDGTVKILASAADVDGWARFLWPSIEQALHQNFIEPEQLVKVVEEVFRTNEKDSHFRLARWLATPNNANTVLLNGPDLHPLRERIACPSCAKGSAALQLFPGWEGKWADYPKAIMSARCLQDRGGCGQLLTFTHEEVWSLDRGERWSKPAPPRANPDERELQARLAQFTTDELIAEIRHRLALAALEEIPL